MNRFVMMKLDVTTLALGDLVSLIAECVCLEQAALDDLASRTKLVEAVAELNNREGAFRSV